MFKFLNGFVGKRESRKSKKPSPESRKCVFRLRLPSFAKIDPGLASVAHEYPAHVWSKLGKTFRTAMAGVTKNYLGGTQV